MLQLYQRMIGCYSKSRWFKVPGLCSDSIVELEEMKRYMEGKYPEREYKVQKLYIRPQRKGGE